MSKKPAQEAPWPFPAARKVEGRRKDDLPAVDPNVETVRQEMKDRAAMGLKKYGKTTRDNPLELVQWLQHAKEEAMDFVIYCEAAIQKLKGNQ